MISMSRIKEEEEKGRGGQRGRKGRKAVLRRVKEREKQETQKRGRREREIRVGERVRRGMRDREVEGERERSGRRKMAKDKQTGPVYLLNKFCMDSLLSLNPARLSLFLSQTLGSRSLPPKYSSKTPHPNPSSPSWGLQRIESPFEQQSYSVLVILKLFNLKIYVHNVHICTNVEESFVFIKLL